MRIAVTGASGFIGRHLVARLSQLDHTVVVLGRNVEHLWQRFPDCAAHNYENLPEAFAGADAVLHLAAALPGQAISDEAYISSNVTLTQKVADAAVQAKVPLFVNFATLGWNDTAYSKSKKQAEEILMQFDGLDVTTLRLPAVYADEFRGRLSVLNEVPQFIRPVAFQLLAALRPTVHMDRITDATLHELQSPAGGEQIVSDQQQGNAVYAVFKTIVDYGFALSTIILFWWVLLITFIVVRLSSKGPAIFAQTRVGQAGKPFTCYKFRTMKIGTRSVGTHEVSASSVTKVGSFLRKTKIDELPQVLNILRGELGLVGPRPCLPVQDELIAERTARGVDQTLPGITGLAQINGVDMSDPEKLATMDLEYINLRSIPLDLKIIMGTLLGRGVGDRVK